jgi:hypothetical protein
MEFYGHLHLNLISCADTWKEIRMKGQVVSWWRLLWFDHTIARHSFIGWLAMKNKLPTKEMMI